MAKYFFKKGDKNPRYQNEYNHSLYGSRIYKIWSNMKTRCSNKNTKDFHLYGGKGIKVCDRWNKFSNFYNDMKQGYKDNLTIDRIDNNKGYCKENCRWATPKEQALNTKHIENAERITFRGLTKTIREWSDLTGIKRTTLGMRLQYYKWPVNIALTKGGHFE